ncbi:TetR/AcrR family transcriptional regulator [Actinokineospora enzanensis]|uniref:TetR/AcrR family transcriptional regulator n=1 Tax=Actinokineospora enzanensis TaxID=155975 RepID=UPI0003A0F109|nr:TetR/AcrR family transcriptional regulator [Actinokineospora enzanensis]
MPRPRSGNRRDETARQSVLHAADDLLVEHGFSGLTIESIARRAGVAKQTIYRWWPSKVEILLDTLIEDTGKRLPVPTDNPTAATIRTYLGDYARFLTEDPAGKVLLTLIAESQHNPTTAESFHQRYLIPRRTQERAMLTQTTATGEISPKLPDEDTLDALIGPITYCALTGRPISDPLLNALFEDLLNPTSSNAGQPRQPAL